MNHLRYINRKTVQIFKVPEQYINDLIAMGDLPINTTEHDVEAVDVNLFDKIYSKIEKRLRVKK